MEKPQGIEGTKILWNDSLKCTYYTGFFVIVKPKK